MIRCAVAVLPILAVACGGTAEPAKSARTEVAIDSRAPAAASKAASCAEKPTPERLRCLAERAVALEATFKGKPDHEGPERIARQKAIALYRQLADEYPKQVDLGEVLYYLAFEEEQDGDNEAALRVYREILDKAPKSKYAANAHLAFGEAAFIAAQGAPAQWQVAIAEYTAALATPDSPIVGYAHYKLGYCHWNDGNYQEALAAFQKAIAFAAAHSDNANAANVARSARKDMIPVYAASGRPERAFAFFDSVAGDKPGERVKTLTMLDALGANLMDIGKPADALVVYRDLAHHDDKNHFCKSVQRQADCIAGAPGPAGKDAADLASWNRQRCVGVP